MTDSENDATTGPARGTRVLGSLRSADGRGVVRIEDRFETDVDDLWTALTEPDRLARWYGEVDGDLRLGGRFDLYLEPAGLRAVGRVEACEPPRFLRVVTRETDESYADGQGVPPFDSTIEATLTADGDRTQLILEIRGLPRDAIAFYGAGWQLHAENLASYLAGGARAEAADGDRGEARWGELVPAYQALAAGIDQHGTDHDPSTEEGARA